MSEALRHNRGFALVAALLLVSVVSIVTATVLQTTSTEVQISVNHKRAVQDFYAAEAGLAEARARLWKAHGTAGYFIGGAGSWSDPRWAAYIAVSADWSPSVDPDYAPPLVQHASVQTALPYWVKIRHYTERDAERAGHTTGTPHYVDLDGRLSRHTSTTGRMLYFGYPSPTSLVPVAFTTTRPTPWLPVEKLVAHGGRTASGVVLEEDVVHPPGPPQLGALYAAGNVNLAGMSGVINGHDACGMVGSLPPVFAGGAVTSAPSLRFDGSPAGPQSDALVLNLEAALADLGRGAAALHGDQHHQPGTADVPMVWFASGASAEGIRIRHTSGYGILLVDGNATLEGDVQWNGMILVTGTVFLRGEGSVIVVHGGLWAGQVDQQAGSFIAHYDSCLLRAALLAVPVRVRTWKEVF